DQRQQIPRQQTAELHGEDEAVAQRSKANRTGYSGPGHPMHATPTGSPYHAGTSRLARAISVVTPYPEPPRRPRGVSSRKKDGPAISIWAQGRPPVNSASREAARIAPP